MTSMTGFKSSLAGMALRTLSASLSLALVPACAGKTPEAAEPLRQVQQARYFSGPDGMHVEAADFADDSSLVQITGLPSELTGKVLSYQRVLNGERLEYRTKWHGNDLYALVKERDGRWVAYIPGAQNGYDLAYSEEKSGSVDTAKLQRSHQEQTRSGELESLQRFDRAAREKSANDALAEIATRTSQQCGGKPLPVSVNWPSVTDQQMLERSVSGYCESILSGLQRLCETQVGKQLVSQSIGAVECSFDGDNRVTLAQQKLRWAITFEITNADQRAYDALLQLKPEGSPHTVQQQVQVEQTAVCADAESKHVVLVGPRDAPHHGLAYGDGKAFAWVRSPEALGDGWFFDPRQRNEQNNDNFRGLDLRLFSHVDVDRQAGTCKLTCGTRQTDLKVITGTAKEDILDHASYGPSPMTREPYALARDKAGNYYFVDRGTTDATARDFHLYKGPRGKLKELPMKDVVSDSEGEIFASTNGKLRLVLGKQAAQWIAGSTAQLTLLPLTENYGLIYNELGVYLSARLGVPCDDL